MILELESAKTISEIAGIKKMIGYKSYFRLRIGNYRIGFENLGNSIRLIIIANRKDIYKIFPR